MTDESAAPAPATKDALVIVPSFEGHLEHERRIAALEEQQPAAGAEEDDVHARLDRHRAELEAIKRWASRLLEELRPVLGPIITAQPPAAAPTKDAYQ